MGQPFVERARREPIPWAYCGACATSYDARTEHECDDDPLGPARGIALCVAGGGVLYVVLALAFLWWPFG